MKNTLATLLGVLFSSLVLAQNVLSPSVQRQVQGKTLVSKELPAAQFAFSESYRYVGGLVVSLYGNAEAEHMFLCGLLNLDWFIVSTGYSSNTFCQITK